MGNESPNMGIFISHNIVDNLRLYFILDKISGKEAAKMKRLVGWIHSRSKVYGTKRLENSIFLIPRPEK
jgi:hypothetical protein